TLGGRKGGAQVRNGFHWIADPSRAGFHPFGRFGGLDRPQGAKTTDFAPPRAIGSRRGDATVPPRPRAGFTSRRAVRRGRGRDPMSQELDAELSRIYERCIEEVRRIAA